MAEGHVTPNAGTPEPLHTARNAVRLLAARTPTEPWASRFRRVGLVGTHAVRSRRVRAGAVAGPPWAAHSRRGTQTPRDGGRDSPVDVPSAHPRPRRRAASGDARQPGPHGRMCGRTVHPSQSPAPALPRGRRRDWPPGPAGGVLGGGWRTRAGDQRGRGQVPLGSGDLAPRPSPPPPLPWQRPAAVTQGRTTHVGPGQALPSLLCGF